MLTSDSMRIAVLGAGGGLGRNVVDAARAAKHDVVALVRDPKRAELPDDVTTVVGDATHVDDVVRAMAGADATMFCVNPPFATWLTTFPPLLACAIAAARKTNTRLVFPANVMDVRSGPRRGARRRNARAGTDVAARQAARRDGATDSRSGHSLRHRSPARVLTVRTWCRCRRPCSKQRSPTGAPCGRGRSMSRSSSSTSPMPGARHGGSRGRRGLRRRHLPSSGRSDDAAPVRRARVPGGGSQAARVRRAALGAVHRRRVRCERTRRGRHRTSVDASDPARWRKVQRTLRRDPPDSARRRDRDDARVASPTRLIRVQDQHPVDVGLKVSTKGFLARRRQWLRAMPARLAMMDLNGVAGITGPELASRGLQPAPHIVFAGFSPALCGRAVEV
jgi:hypothetical protein